MVLAKNRPSSPHQRRRVLVLVGPTASGKTAVSLIVAPQLNAEIISSDSRQVYKYMDIGTAKPTHAERSVVPHYFIDELPPEREFNAGEFGIRGRVMIDEMFARGKTPFVVGGSGLYVRALIDGFFEGPSADPALRKRLYDRIESDGAERLLQELRVIDPVAAAKMLPSNTRRIVRALEVYHLTGIPISILQQSLIDIPFTPILVGLEWDRSVLYQRINDRVDEMLSVGLLDEVRSLAERGYAPTLNSLQTTGYMEAFRYMTGEMTYDQMVDLIKQNTRRYAKRQLTWFRHDPRITWFRLDGEHDFQNVARKIVRHFREATI
jgi:tRNA dimethylallyltransferase